MIGMAEAKASAPYERNLKLWTRCSEDALWTALRSPEIEEAVKKHGLFSTADSILRIIHEYTHSGASACATWNLFVSPAGLLFLVGGQSGPLDFCAHAHVFNPINCSLTQLPDLPEARTAPLVLRHSKFLYVCGGMASGGVKLRSCWRYDVTSDRWERLPDMKATHSCGALVLIQNESEEEKLFAIGSDNVESLTASQAGATWNTVPNMPALTDMFLSATASGSHIFMAGKASDRWQLYIFKDCIRWELVANICVGDLDGEERAMPMLAAGYVYIVNRSKIRRWCIDTLGSDGPQVITKSARTRLFPRLGALRDGTLCIVDPDASGVVVWAKTEVSDTDSGPGQFTATSRPGFPRPFNRGLSCS